MAKFYDNVLHRTYNYLDYIKVREAVYKINERLKNDEDVCINELYSKLEITCPESCKNMVFAKNIRILANTIWTKKDKTLVIDY